MALYGSLGATGKGHGTDKGVMLGLVGHAPDMVDPDQIEPLLAAVRGARSLSLPGGRPVRFVETEHIAFFRREAFAEHPNGLNLVAVDADGSTLADKSYLSVGGGFIMPAGGSAAESGVQVPGPAYPFRSGKELTELCAVHGMSIAQIMLENEKLLRPERDVRAGLLAIWAVMRGCLERGCRASGHLPGPMKVKRRTPELYRHLTERGNAASPIRLPSWTG